METTNSPLPDPVELINRLDPESISSRLNQIKREREALLVLLRAARRAIHKGKVAPITRGGNHHA